MKKTRMEKNTATRVPRDSSPYRASPEQLPLTFSSACVNTETSLHSFFTEKTGRAIKLTLTDNSTSMLSVRDLGSHLAVRLHRMFLEAGSDVLSELAAYIKTRRRKTPLFWEFINSNHERLSVSKPKKPRLVTKGRFHDLAEIYDCLNEEYFNGKLSPSITWGARRRVRARQRTLGSFTASVDLIRINPVLDARRVPRYYVEFVVYHEMLHAALFMEDREAREAGEAGEAGGNGQNKRNRRIHPPEFKQRERQFKDYARAIKWEGR